MQTALATLPLLLAAALLPGAPAPVAPASARVCDEAYLGVYVVPSLYGGAEVTRLMEGSPAEAAGIEPGDRIVALGGIELADADALIAAIDGRTAGEEVEVVLYRGDDRRIVTLALGNRDESEVPRLGDPFRVELEFAEPSFEADAPWVAERVQAPATEVAPRVTWVPLEPGAAAGRQDALQERLDDMRARMEERWADLSARLEELREARGAGGPLRERIEDFRREMEASRHEQQRRLEDLREAVRAAAREAADESAPRGTVTQGMMWQGPDGVRHWVQTRPRPTDAPEPQRAPGFTAVRPPQPPAPAPTADEIRSLHDDVRALRAEIRELKELLTRDRR